MTSNATAVACAEIWNNLLIMNNTTIARNPETPNEIDTAGVIIIIVYSILAVVCILANSLVCYVIVTRRTTNGSLKYYVFSLAITDILVGVVCIPLFLSKEYTSFAKWHLLESFSTGFDILLGTGSIMHLCLMAFDRVMSVTKPIVYHTVLRHKKAALRLLFIPWLIAIAVANSPFIGRSKKFEYYTAIMIVGLIPIPCVFMVICYAKLYYTIKRRNTVLRQSSQTDLSVDQTHMLKMILCMVLVFISCWIPLMIYYIIQYTDYTIVSPQEDRIFHNSAKFLSYFNSVCNPTIYALLNPVFRNGFKDVLRSCFRLNRTR